MRKWAFWTRLSQFLQSRRGPKTGKFQKVVRRGCKRYFEPRDQKSPKNLLPFWTPLSLPGLKWPLAPSPNYFWDFTIFGFSHGRWLSDCNPKSFQQKEWKFEKNWLKRALKISHGRWRKTRPKSLMQRFAQQSAGGSRISHKRMYFSQSGTCPFQFSEKS